MNQAKTKREINTVDLFCGAGGATTGLELALERLGLRHRGLAINHWKIAVETMTANHPDVDTKQMSIEAAVPADLVPGGRVDFLWASPSCTHHSRAKGGKPRDDQQRAQPELLFTWLDQLYVRRFCVENVPEFVEWAPLGLDKKPLKSRIKLMDARGVCCANGGLVKVGSSFQAWINAIKARSYDVEWKIVNCANYGDATTRRRFFLQAVRKGCGRIVWPEPTHAEDPQPTLFGPPLKKWRGIRECLDLSDTGTSIFNRPHPLAKNTLRRVFVGLRKYCGLDFQLDFLGADGPDEPRLRSTAEPLATQPAGGNRTALVRSFLVRFNNHADAESVEKPLSVVTAHAEHHALCSALIMDHFKNGEARPADAPVGAQPTHDRFSVVQAFAVDMSHPGDTADEGRVSPGSKPLKTATARNNTAAAFVVTDQAHNAPRSVDKPIRTQTAVRKDYIVRPLVLGRDANAKCRPADKPMPTLTTGGAMRVFTPLVLGQQSGAECRPADKPCPTVATAGSVRVVAPIVVDMSRPSGPDSGHISPTDGPIRTITTFDNLQGTFLLTENGDVIDVRMRMLKPSELAAAHSFPADYKLVGNRAEQVKQIGNSVPCRTAAAICEAALSA